MDKLLFRKRVRAIAARLGVLRPLRNIIIKLRGGNMTDSELTFLRRFIQPGHHVFDVGANRGQSAEKYIDLGARVTAFEPQTDLHAEIRQLCRNSPMLTIESCGLGRKVESRRFFITSYDQVASLRDDWEGNRIGEKTIGISTLDIQIERHGLPDFCKIDVEGWELEVLEGLTHPIPILSFEYHRSDTELARAVQVLERLANIGNYFCNLRPAESPGFSLCRFEPITTFISRFPNYSSLAPNSGYGDIFCALDPTRIKEAGSGM
jgi:FkbM family methyltransferase